MKAERNETVPDPANEDYFDDLKIGFQTFDK